MTTVFSPSENWAVPLALAAEEIDWPMPSASDDENASTRISVGRCLSRACLTGSLHMTPEDATMNMLARFQRSGFSSRARTIGLPKASPTMAIWLTPSRSIVSNISTMSRRRETSVTLEPPIDRMMSWV